MPHGSASSGKRDMKGMLAEAYKGSSASQKAGAAEWTGELPWNTANHPRNAKHHDVQASNFKWRGDEYLEPWYEFRDDEWYCLLCQKTATQQHIDSQAHQKREAQPEYYGFPRAGGIEPASSPVPASREFYPEPWYELRDGEWHCLLCRKTATQQHIDSQGHKQRESYPDYYGFPRGDRHSTAVEQTSYHDKAAVSIVRYSAPVPPQYNEPWLELREGEWYCKLCNKWATPEHLSNKKHEDRAAHPEWYGFSIHHQCVGSSSHQHSNAAGAAAPDGFALLHHHGATETTQVENAAYLVASTLPPPWEKYWSPADQKHYYHNRATQTTQWDPPPPPPPSLPANTTQVTASKGEEEEVEC